MSADRAKAMNHGGSTCRTQETSVPALAGTEVRAAPLGHEVVGVAVKLGRP
jgi:hypothetical protein